ncbi:hypothetical protein T03_17565, partial [Trichinella britovi]
LTFGSLTVLSTSNKISFTMHFSAPLTIVLLALLIEVHDADALFGRYKPWLLQCIFQNLHIFLFTIFIVCNWLANFSEKAKRVTKRNEHKWEACFDFLYSVKCGQEECKEFKEKVDAFSKNQRNSPEFADAFKNFDQCSEECFDRILKEKNLEEYHEQLNRLQIEGSTCNKNSQLFMAALKRKYGVKIKWICDAENGYALKGSLYTGRNSEERQIGLASTNKRLYGLLFYIIFHCATSLEHGLTSIGIVFAHHRDVLACLLKVAQRDPYSILAVYEHNKRITMITYVPRKNSNVLLLTSCHTKLKVDNQQGDKKPNIMND